MFSWKSKVNSKKRIRFRSLKKITKNRAPKNIMNEIVLSVVECNVVC